MSHRSIILSASLLASLGGVLAACATGPAGPQRPPQARLDDTCDNGEQVTMRFFPDQGTAVLVRGGQNTELNRGQSGGDIVYSSGQTSVRTSAERTPMTMSVGMMAPTRCQGRLVNPFAPPLQPPVPPPAERPGTPVLPPSPAQMRVDFRCDNGEQVAVRFFPHQGIGVLERGGQNVELNQSRTPPGFTYSNGQTTLRVADDRLSMLMNVGMMATANCIAR